MIFYLIHDGKQSAMNPPTSAYSESSTASEALSEHVCQDQRWWPHECWTATRQLGVPSLELHISTDESSLMSVPLFSQVHLFSPAVARLPLFFFIGRLPLLVAMICDNGLEVGQRSQVPVGASCCCLLWWRHRKAWFLIEGANHFFSIAIVL